MEAPETRPKRKSLFSSSEKKRRRSELVKRANRSRVVIGDEFDRWREVQKDLGLKTDALTAKFLLDGYFERISHSDVMPGSSGMATSTPVQTSSYKRQLVHGPEISSLESDSSERTLTGVDTLPETESENGNSRLLKSHQVLRSGRVSEKKASGSFLDPFELSIDVSLDVEEEDDQNSDSDYEPGHFLTAVLPEEVNRATEDLTFEEVEFGMEREEDKETEEQEEDCEDILEGPGIVKISTEEESNHLPEETMCLVFMNQLLSLAESTRRPCKECRSSVKVMHDFIGSAVYLKWICDKGHVVHRWCSQPVLNRRLHSGDFLSALAIVTSGNNFGKVALFAKMLNLKFLSASTFHRIQATYLVPSVDNFWASHQEEVLESFSGQELIILGDGRMDSPGHSAQYCTYTVMENATKKILILKALEKRMTDRKSGNMEKKGFQSCMEDLEEKGLTVKEVVTDAHLGIGALMKSQYPNIKHSNDVWHAAKNLGKKLLKAGQRKGCGVLLRWSKDIVNHFWFSCKTASSYPEFMSIWRGVLHHVTNQHSWVLSHGDGVNHCSHGPLTEEERTKPWLDKTKDGEALSALASVVLDKRFLNRIHYLLNFRSTSELEVFNQLVLMYCAKRFAYSPPTYRMRNLLAALDHNMHIDRPQRKNKQGNIIYNRFYNKKSGRWSVHPLKVEKTYNYVRGLAKKALAMRLRDKVGMKRKKELEPQDPRRISMHLAPIAPPPTQELVAEQVSRFGKD